MTKIIDFKGFVIGATFLLVISGIGSWWFKIAFWQALLIGFACMVVLGLIAVFENGDQQHSNKKAGPE